MTNNEEKQGTSDRLLRFLIPLAFAAVAGLGIWLGLNYFRLDSEMTAAPPVEKMQAATLLPKPKVLSPFSLTSQDAQPFGLDDLEGRWTFLAIGFASCPEVCPTILATLRDLDRELRVNGAAPALGLLFISVDPERDSPARLSEHMRAFNKFQNPHFLAATGSHDQLRALTGQLALMYALPPDRTGNYMVDHTASILLLDPQARLAAIFSWPHDDLDKMTADFAILNDHYQE